MAKVQHAALVFEDMGMLRRNSHKNPDIRYGRLLFPANNAYDKSLEGILQVEGRAPGNADRQKFNPAISMYLTKIEEIV
jgi:hypothetical protein